MEITNKDEKKCKVIEEIFNIVKSIQNSDIGIYTFIEQNNNNDKYIFSFYTRTSRLVINTDLILSENDIIPCYYIRAGKKDEIGMIYKVKLSELERFIVIKTQLE